ncbi:MAG: N-acetyltransferase [Hormoscilla sp. GUM202]|nr:N-acetyltransferase [Hormoscilla sp. GUM202]
MFIRDASAADLPRIVEIYNCAIPRRLATADLEPVSVEDRMAWYSDHSPTTRPLWVIELEGNIAGWLSFQSFFSGRAAYDATAEISIYLDPSFQRRGLGQKLLSQAISTGPALGLNTLVALIFAHNQPSLRLFSKFNFQRWGIVEPIGFDRFSQASSNCSFAACSKLY